jgi:phosphoserine phosphatase
MDIALTLVVNPEFSVAIDDVAKSALAALTVSDSETVVLSNKKAIDLLFDFASAEAAKISLAALNDIEGLDWVVQSADSRKKKLILADMDSTMITVECIDELADFMDLKDQVSAITEAAMRGELDFEGALAERVALLEGLSEAQLKACYDERIELMAGGRTLVQTMKANGAYAALVSGGFTYFTQQVAAAIGFDLNRANVLEIEDGALTGKVILPICGAQTKLDTLNELAAKFGFSKNEIAAVGDGANDIPMIEGASLGVAYHAHPRTRAAASTAVTYGDLTALLYFQGYRDEDFVS